MAASTEPVLGLNYGWALGESGWNLQMDSNLLRLGALAQLAVTNRITTAPPASPADGDRYIVAAAATGAWVGKDAQVAVWRAGISAWEFYAPRAGWLCVVLAEAKLIYYTGTAWSAGVVL